MWSSPPSASCELCTRTLPEGESWQRETALMLMLVLALLTPSVRLIHPTSSFESDVRGDLQVFRSEGHEMRRVSHALP